MPIMFSYNLTGQEPVDNNHIQSMLERLGWESVGGSSYRYPPLAARSGPEDWFNNVVPALMLFRAYVLKRNLVVPKFSLDVTTSTGLSDAPAGAAPAARPLLSPPGNGSFGEQKLKDWLDAVTSAVPY